MEDIKKRVFDNIDKDKTIQMLADMISMPSYPDFTKAQDEWELPKLRYIDQKCKEAGLETVWCGEVPNGRWQSVLGFLRGEERKIKIAYHGHVDTHPPMDWRLYDPLHVPRAPVPHPHAPTIKDGKIYGLGAGDNHSSTAAFICAAEAIKKTGVRLKYDAMGVFDPGEMECGQGGQVAIDWMKANKVVPEFMVTGEMNAYDVGVAQNLVVGFEIEINSLAGFSISLQQQALFEGYGNSFERMVEVACDLKAMVAEERRFQFKNPLKTSGPRPMPMDAHMWFGGSYAGSRFWSVGHAMAPYEPLPPNEEHRHVTHSRGGFDAHAVPEIAKMRFEFVVPPRELKPGEVYTFDPAPGLSRKELEELITKRLEKLWKDNPTGCTYQPLRTIRVVTGPYIISADEPHVKKFVKSVHEGTGREPKCSALFGTYSEGAAYSKALGEFPFVSYSAIAENITPHRPDEHCEINALLDTTYSWASAILDFCEVV